MLRFEVQNDQLNVFIRKLIIIGWKLLRFGKKERITCGSWYRAFAVQEDVRNVIETERGNIRGKYARKLVGKGPKGRRCGIFVPVQVVSPWLF